MHRRDGQSRRRHLAASASTLFDNADGLDKPNIGLLDDEFLAQVRNLPERNLAVELLERLLEGEIKSKFASNVVQQKNAYFGPT